MKTIIISHESDVDGIFSASIALMRFPQAKTFFTSYGKENFLRISEILYKEIIATQESGQVIISDLGLNDDMIDLFKEIFIFLKSNLWSITWIDHHPWSENAIKSAIEGSPVRLILDKTEKQCASDLMYNSIFKRQFGCRMAIKNSPFNRLFYQGSRDTATTRVDYILQNFS